MTRTRRAMLGLGACVLLQACTTPAEHSNPLDPDSPAYTNAGALRVRVTTLYQPYQPLAGARIRLLPAHIEVQSDAAGQYLFEDLASGDYTIIASRAGYDTVQIATQVRAREVQTIEPRLNAVPEVRTAQLTSTRIATRQAALPRLFLEVVVEATDRDGANDVTRVTVQFPGRAPSDTLQRDTDPARWKRTFTEDELAPLSLHNLVGMPVLITARDGAAKLSAPFAAQVVRLINEEPLPSYPQNGQIINPNNIVLRWELPTLNFEHKQSVEIVRLDAGFPVTISTANNIHAGDTSLPYPGRLASGTYYWTVKLIDSFGNSSRSKEASFAVQ